MPVTPEAVAGLEERAGERRGEQISGDDPERSVREVLLENTGSDPACRLLEVAAEADVVLVRGSGRRPDREVVDTLLSAIRDGAEVAVANTEAARTDPDSLRRRAGRWLVRTLLSPIDSLQELSELRGGCIACRGEVLRGVLVGDTEIREAGAGAVVELVLRLAAAGACIVQAPVAPEDAPRVKGFTVMKALLRHRRKACQLARARELESRLRELSEAASRAARSDTACRVVSFVVAATGIVLTLPLMVVIGVLVKLTSRGPIIFTQTRVGIDRREDSGTEENRRRRLDVGGKPFNIYKFRTMYWEPGDRSQVWAEPDDPRVTPLGRFLRTTRLDELPQLFNVLAGDMNVVGPRPEQPKIALKLRSEIEGYQVRHRVPPGLTGRAQVYHTYDQSLEDVRRKVAYDLEYLSRRSVQEDLEIMARTLPVVIFRRGAW